MANSNTLYTPENLAAATALYAERDLGLLGLVDRSFEANFGGGTGHSVNVKRPNVRIGRTRVLPTGQETNVTVDAQSEAVISIVLDTEAYDAVPVSDYDLTLKVEDYVAQFTGPQSAAVVRQVNQAIATKLEAVTPTIDVTYATASSVVGAFSTARATLRKKDTPMSNLLAVCGVDAYGALLDLDLVDTSGGYGRSEGVPQVRGFRVVENNMIADDRIVFYHPIAFHCAVRAPAVSQGQVFAYSTTSNDVALRVFRSYNSTIKREEQHVDTYFGVDDLGFVRLNDAGTAGEVYSPAIAADPDVA